MRKLLDRPWTSSLAFAPLSFLLLIANLFSSNFLPDIRILSNDEVDAITNFEAHREAASFLTAVFLGLFVTIGFVINFTKPTDLRSTFSLWFGFLIFIISQVFSSALLFNFHVELTNILSVGSPTAYHLVQILRWCALFLFLAFSSQVVLCIEVLRQRSWS